MAAKAVFFDRDGVLNETLIRDGKAYAPLALEEFRIIPEAKLAIEQLVARGFLIFVFSNQPDVARGKLPAQELEKMNRKLADVLGGGVLIRDIFVCTHDNSDNCDCRKPKPGMLLAASQSYQVDLKRSFVVGDRGVDIAAGRACGATTVLLDAIYNQNIQPDFRAHDILEAAQWILKQKEE